MNRLLGIAVVSTMAVLCSRAMASDDQGSPEKAVMDAVRAFLPRAANVSADKIDISAWYADGNRLAMVAYAGSQNGRKKCFLQLQVTGKSLVPTWTVTSYVCA